MRLNKLLSFIIGIGLAAPASLTWAAYQFSEYGFSRNNARVDNSLRVQMSGRTALRSYRFVGRVGGVNFETSIDLSDMSVELDYDRSAPDGSRARMEVNGEEYSLPLYDWELKPIAEYANSNYTAVVSIFGEGPEPENFRYIDYHPAFEDTHLGMRLLQADILLMDPMTFSEVPAENGRKVYRPGEAQEQSLKTRLNGASTIHNIMASETYHAWVLTDTDLTGRLRYEGGVARVDLTPYYHVWKSKETGERDRLIEAYNRLLDAVRPQLAAYDEALESYQSAPGGSVDQLDAQTRLLSLQNSLQPASDQLASLRTRIENYEPEIVDVDGLIAKLRTAGPELHRMAPFVYEAVRKTARHAALFRGVKEAHPDEWQRFHRAVVRSISLNQAETPNQFRRH